MADKDRDDYEVGYGRPPAHARFQPGQSGNPSGRPRGKPTINDVLRRELGRFVKAKIGNSVAQITKLEALMRNLVHKAIEGDIAAGRLIVHLMAKGGPGDTAEDLPLPTSFTTEPPDEEAIERIMARLSDLYPGERTSDE